jgi:hypothetical protein
MLRRTRSQPRQQPRAHATAIHDLPEGQQRLIRAGLEALRDPEMERRVHAHLEARGDSPRDLIGAALVAARFHREQNGIAAASTGPKRSNGVSQSA